MTVPRDQEEAQDVPDPPERLLHRVWKGEATRDDVLAAQDLYDNHFQDSPAWHAARSASNPPPSDP